MSVEAKASALLEVRLSRPRSSPPTMIGMAKTLAGAAAPRSARGSPSICTRSADSASVRPLSEV